MEAEVAEFLAARGKAACAPLIANAFRAAEYPEAEWVEALIQMSPETLAELIAAVEAEAAAAGVAASPSHEPEPEPEQLPAAPPPPLQQQQPQQQQPQQQQPLLLGFDGAAATMAAAPAALPDPFGLGVPTSQTSVPPIPLEGVDLLGMAPAPAAQPPSIDLLGGGAPPPISGGGGGGYLSASDTEGGASSIALPQGSAALPEPVFTLVCFPSELVGEKPRRVYVKALGGTFEGLKTSLQQRLELEDAEFTITLDGAEPGHFVQHLADFDAEAGSYAVHIERTVEAEAALQIRHVNEVINGQIKADMRNFLRSGFGCAWNPAMIDTSETGPDAPPFSNAKMMAAAGLAEWTKTSGWARDTGGEIDPVTGAPVRAQDGVLKDLWGEVLAEEQQRAELLTMFPDLQLSPEARDSSLSSPRSQQQQQDQQLQQLQQGSGSGDGSGGEWQGVLSNLAAEISMDMSATTAARSQQEQQEQAAREAAEAAAAEAEEDGRLGSRLLGMGRKKRAELAANAEQ